MSSKISAALICSLFALSHNAFSAIHTVSMKEAPDVITYSRASLDKGKDAFLTSQIMNGKSVVRMSPITDTAGKTVEVEFPSSIVFLASSQNADLVIGADAAGEWIANRIANRKIVKQTKLNNFSTVTSAAENAAGYVVSGRDLNGYPRIISLDRNLVVIKSFSYKNNVSGEANIVAIDHDSVTVIMNYVDGKSAVIWLSNTLSLTREIVLGGGAASAALLDDGVVVSYSSGKDIVVEVLDKTGQSKWKMPVQKRNGASSLKFELCSLNNGFGVIGANNATLVVIRIARDGKITQISSDKSGLAPPTDSRYVVSVSGNDIHILGVAYKSNSDAKTPPFLFHFVDTPQ